MSGFRISDTDRRGLQKAVLSSITSGFLRNVWFDEDDGTDSYKA